MIEDVIEKIIGTAVKLIVCLIVFFPVIMIVGLIANDSAYGDGNILLGLFRLLLDCILHPISKGLLLFIFLSAAMGIWITKD